MELTAESSFERNDSFIIKRIEDCDVTCKTVGLTSDSDDVVFNNADDKKILKTTAVDNNGSVPGAKNRKNKPPNLNIIPRVVMRQNAQADSGSPVNIENDSEPVGGTLPVVVLRKTGSSITEPAGRSSPVVKRSSMLEQILEIPDVKAALVKDEGYELLRLRNHETVATNALANRQPTPACSIDTDRFSFDPQSPDVDSESITESDSSSVHSCHDSCLESGASNSQRPHVEVLKDSKRVTNTFDRIADSTGPSILFGNQLKKDSQSLPSPLLRKKRRKKTLSTDEEEESSKPNAPKSRALLSRLKFASAGRSGSNSSLEGWDSLARALARVGASSPSLTCLDSADLHPKLSPILKRHSPATRWSSESSCSSQVLSLYSLKPLGVVVKCIFSKPAYRALHGLYQNVFVNNYTVEFDPMCSFVC